MAAQLQRRAPEIVEDSLADIRRTVDLYYRIQTFRISQGTADTVSLGGSELLEWAHNSLRLIEEAIRISLDESTRESELSRWCRSIKGMTSVFAAGLMGHIDITRAANVTDVWSFAGLDPSVTWDAGQPPPYDTGLRGLCFRIGESFVKAAGCDGDVYGRVYLERLKLERQWNEGKLSASHIHGRARRYAVKVFLWAYFEVAWWCHYRTVPPKIKPSLIDHLKEIEYSGVPNEHLVRGLTEARQGAPA